MNTISRYLSIALILASAGICKAQIITTFAGTGLYGSSGWGVPATSSAFEYVQDAVADNAGNVYITDGSNTIYKVDPTGWLTVFAGVGSAGTAGDGGPATAAEISNNSMLAVDGLNNVYVEVDSKIRKINVATGIINTVAGSGSCIWGLTGDGGPALSAEMCGLSGIAVRGTTSPHIYFSQWAYQVVRQAFAGTMYAFAGYYTASGAYTGDGGPAASAQLYYPGGIAADPAGNIYICDRGNRVIRKVNTSGIISTFAGNPAVYDISGDGGPATAAGFMDPIACAFDGHGNLYVADYYGNVVRKINAAGIITTLAGSGTAGYSGDNGPGPFAKINRPIHVSSDNAGNVYIADENNVVRKVSATGNIAPTFVGGYYQHLGMCVDAAPVSINSLLAVTDANTGQNETWDIVKLPSHGTLAGLPATMSSTGGTLTLTGVTYTPDAGYMGVDTFKVSITDDTSVSYTTVYVAIDTAPGAGVITGTPTVCVGGTTVLADTVAGGTWSVSNANATVAGGTVSGVTAGTDTVIYVVTNGCAAGRTTLLVTVNPIASPGTITGLSAVCVGATISLTDAVTGGTWSVTNGTASVAGGFVTGITAGIDTVKYTLFLGSCPSYATHVVSVNTVPAVPPILGAVTVCVGDSISLTSTVTGVWSISNSRATISATGYVTGVASGVDTVHYTVANSCGSTTGDRVITVKAPPTTAGTIGGADTVCVGAFVMLTHSLAGGMWSSSDTAIATVLATGKVTGHSTGVVTISYTITNTCGSATATYLVNVGCNTGVEERDAAAALRIYPNPNNGSFYVSGANNSSEPATIVVSDLSGKEISRQSERVSNGHKIDLDVPAGVYMVAVYAEGRVARAAVLIR